MKALTVTKIHDIDGEIVRSINEISEIKEMKKLLTKHVAQLQKRVEHLAEMSKDGVSEVTLGVERRGTTVNYTPIYVQNGNTQTGKVLWSEEVYIKSFEYKGGVKPLPEEVEHFPESQLSITDEPQIVNYE
ncbi:MAG: hypothetical protein AAF740_10300 [Bacteroidota bacterium]